MRVDASVFPNNASFFTAIAIVCTAASPPLFRLYYAANSQNNAPMPATDSAPTAAVPPNQFYVADSLAVLRALPAASVDLIYTEPRPDLGQPPPDAANDAPPTEPRLAAYADAHPLLFNYLTLAEELHGARTRAYLAGLAPCLVEMYRALKPAGSLYLHCKPTRSPYARIILDAVFGADGFRNEVIWHYPNKSRVKRRPHWKPMSDSILFYAKSRAHTWNPQYAKLPQPVKYARVRRTRDGKKVCRRSPAGRIDYKFNHKQLLDNVLRIPLPSGKKAGPRSGPPQKPFELLAHMIRASSHRGEVVLDPFCGDAAVCVAAQKLKRRWIGVHHDASAVQLLTDKLRERSHGEEVLFTDFVQLAAPPAAAE